MINKKVHIIAEAGTNHNGNYDTACRLVDIACSSGADSVKFQIINPEGLYLPKFYDGNSYIDNDVYIKRMNAMLSNNDYNLIYKYCIDKGISFSASIFDRAGLDLLDDLDVEYIKIASCDLNNYEFLKAVAERERKIILSTGMSTLGEIEKAVDLIYRTGNTDLVLMHCVSVYPCATENINLDFITTLKQCFGFPVGLSDHTENSIAAVMSVALGVEWIEKHFTYDRKAEGFDHAYAMEPESLTQFINDVRKAEQAIAKREFKLLDAEIEVKSRARRSLYANRDLAEGEKLTEKDVLIVRPEGPLKPEDLQMVVNKPLKRNIKQYEAISMEMF